MKFIGLWSLSTSNGKRSFTGTSLTLAPDANRIDFNAQELSFFTGQIQNLSVDTDVILSLNSKGNRSNARYTLHAREYIEMQNIPLETIYVVLNGTAVLQGIGEFNELTRGELTGLAVPGTPPEPFNWLQNSYIKIGKISESQFASAPQWQGSTKSTNPAAGSTLSSVAVPAGAQGYIMGIYITAPEPNVFELEWTSLTVAKEKLYIISAGGGGTLIFTDPIPLNSGDPADASTSILLKNTNIGAGDYQADILYSEVAA